jgi:hypothetical protein
MDFKFDLEHSQFSWRYFGRTVTNEKFWNALMTETQITISIENLAPTNGTSLTPFWFGLHDGNFDTYDRGRPASQGVERIAEDGTTAAITQEFNQAGFGAIQGVVTGANGPIAPQ